MSRHDLDLASLLGGLVFLVIGVAYLLDAGGEIHVSSALMAPFGLIGLGVAGLVGSIGTTVRRRIEHGRGRLDDRR